MSLKAVEWASKVEGLTALEKTVLKEIGNRFNDKLGRAWPSQARMASDTGFSRSSINRALSRLEQLGLIIRVSAVDATTGARTSSRYFMPGYAPEHTPTNKKWIKVDRYFEPDGTPQSEEWQ